jgi:hypothetical protein
VTLKTVVKKLKTCNVQIQQLAHANLMQMNLLLSLKEDMAILKQAGGHAEQRKKVHLNSLFCKTADANGIIRAHIYTRIFIKEPYPSELEMYSMFRDMRNTYSKKEVKQWWNDNRKRIMKLFIFFVLI